MKKNKQVRNSCCGNGSFIKLRVLPYGDKDRRVNTGIDRTMRATRTKRELAFA